MNETEYNEITAEIFESSMWTIKFIFASAEPASIKLQQIHTIVSGAFKHVEEEEAKMLSDEE